MTQKIINGALALGLVVVAVLSLHSGTPQVGGGTYEAIPKWFGNGLSAGQNQQLSVDSSGNLSISSGISTSSIGAGCIQTAASSSSATPIKLYPIASSTQLAPGYNGVVLWKYGTCP
jgi:hypothetical protein